MQHEYGRGAAHLGEAPREDIDGQRDWWAD